MKTEIACGMLGIEVWLRIIKKSRNQAGKRLFLLPLPRILLLERIKRDPGNTDFSYNFELD